MLGNSLVIPMPIDTRIPIYARISKHIHPFKEKIPYAAFSFKKSAYITPLEVAIYSLNLLFFFFFPSTSFLQKPYNVRDLTSLASTRD